MPHKLNVLIVGCGNIAGGFDENRGNSYSTHPYTHAGAMTADGRFNLLACVEPDAARRKAFMEFWSVARGFDDLDAVVHSGLAFDVVSLCSPTASHYSDLQKIIALKPKIIFCEKPVTLTAQETETVVNACQQAGIRLAVNHTRAWDASLSQLKQAVDAGEWGELRSIIGTYNKGVLNNGSHLIDLLYRFVPSMHIIAVGLPVFDYTDDEPTIPALLQSDAGLSIHLVAAHAVDYAIFEVQFIFSQGVLVMEKGGFSWRQRRAVDSPVFKGYRMLDEGRFYSGGYDNAMKRAVDNIYRAITRQEDVLETGYTALKVQKFCELLKRQALCNGGVESHG